MNDCIACGGLGYNPDEEACPVCLGWGSLLDIGKKCGVCNGHGHLTRGGTCRQCGGAGRTGVRPYVEPVKEIEHVSEHLGVIGGLLVLSQQHTEEGQQPGRFFRCTVLSDGKLYLTPDGIWQEKDDVLVRVHKY